MSLTVQAVDDEDKWIDEQNGMNVAEVAYLDLLINILNTGEQQSQRAGSMDGTPPPPTNINTWSGAQGYYDPDGDHYKCRDAACHIV